MDFNVNDWLGDWISFEHLINNHDPNLDRAWKDSTLRRTHRDGAHA